MDQVSSRAWYIASPGVASLEIVERPLPVPADNEVLVKVVRAAVNPVDWKRCEYNVPTLFVFPGFVGVDAFGQVVAKGASVGEEYVVNQTYVYFHGNLGRQQVDLVYLFFKDSLSGTFAQYTVQDVNHLSIIRQSLLDRPIEKLASDLLSMVCTGWTSYQIVISKLKLQPGNVVIPAKRNIVVAGGAGGVGAYCLQLLDIYRRSLSDPNSLRIFATCSKSSFEYVLGQGATHVIDRNGDLAAEIQREVGEVDIWIDTVSKATATVGLNSLAFGGELVVVVDNPDYNNDQLFSKQLSVHNVFLGRIHATNNPERTRTLRDIGDKFQVLFEEGKLRPIKYEEVEFDQLPTVLERLRDGKNQNKIILKP